MTTPSIDLAAGGLLERQQDGQPAIAVVHRRRYGRDGESGDWCLPKGHPNPGESLGEAALREVKEETGCTARITGPARTVSYFVVDRPKLVLYHPMQLQEEGTPTDTDEVHSVHWLAPERAVEVLSYDNERHLVRQHYAARFRQPWHRRLWQALTAEPPQPERRRRLQAALDEAARRLEEDRPLRPTSQGEPDWLRRARERLAEAHHQQTLGRRHAAWGLLREVERLRLHALAGRDDLRQVHAQGLLAAAREHLHGWRRDAVLACLAGTEDGAPPDVDRLIHAQHLVDEAEAHRTFRLDQTARRLTTLPWVLLLVVLVLWIVAWLRTPGEAPGVLEDGGQVLLTALLGAIGALVSGVFLTRDPERLTPGLLEPGAELGLRLALGAVLGVLVGVVLDSGLTPLLSSEGPSLLAVVVAGFLGDRLLTGSLNRRERSIRP